MRWALFFSMSIVFGLVWGCDQGGDSPDDDDVTSDDDATDDDAGDDDTVFDPPEWCEAAQADVVQDITTHPSAPYLVHHPDGASLTVPTVVFLPGGGGALQSAEGAWTHRFSAGQGVKQVRAVILYSDDGSLLDEYDRTVDVVAEVLACYGGDPAHVHLSGASNGGRGAYQLMLDHPEPFATLMGAPGYFPDYPDLDDEVVLAALGGKAVYNGAGENDESWNEAAQAMDAYLTGLGIDSIFVEFEGQGHSVDESFDETVFFDFWLAH